MMRKKDLMRKYILTIAVCSLMAALQPLWAADIVIAKGSGKIAVDLSGIQAGADEGSREFLAALQNGLVRSGWLDRGSSAHSDYVVTGTIQYDGASIRAKLNVGQKSANRFLLSESYNGVASNLRGLAHEAADDILYAITGKKGFATARLVMVGNRSGHKELYQCGSDGRGLYALTADKSISLAPKWGPKGEKIYYTSLLMKFTGVYEINLKNRKRSRISNFAGLNTGGEVSPNGKEIALILSKDGNPDLYIMSLSDQSLTRLTRTRAVESSPSWSPDGSQLVYVSDQTGKPDLFVISRQGGSAVQLTSRGGDNVAPDWGSNGLIAYASKIGGRFQICTIQPESRLIRQLTSEYADHEDPSWAPDGRHLAIAKSVSYSSKVYLIDTLGDAPILLTNYEGDWYSPEWSP